MLPHSQPNTLRRRTAVRDLPRRLVSRPSPISLLRAVLNGRSFIWSMTTTILNRSLLRMRAIELNHPEEARETTWRTSPFGMADGVIIVDMDAPPERSPRWLELHKLSSNP